MALSFHSTPQTGLTAKMRSGKQVGHATVSLDGTGEVPDAADPRRGHSRGCRDGNAALSHVQEARTGQMRQSAQAIEDGTSSLVLGLGCERGTSTAEVIALAEEAFSSAGLDMAALVLVASLDTRADEPAIQAVARHYSVPFRVFDPSTLEAETWRLANPSEIVFQHTGCHGVAEASALAAVGPGGNLVVPKMKSAHATAAIAESFQTVVGVSSHIESADPYAESSLGRAV